MRCGLCYVLLQCYVFSFASKPRSVNLALETTFEFNNSRDVAIIDKVRKFLNKIENAVDEKLAKRDGQSRRVDFDFSDFLQELVSTIDSYNDEDFEEVFISLTDSINEYRNKPLKFNEVFNNDRLKYILVEKLKEINRSTIVSLRNQLKKNARDLKSNRADMNFINFLNYLYKRKSTDVLQQTLDNFKRYGSKSTDLNLKDIVNTAIKSLIYDLYATLNENTQRDVKKWFEILVKTNFNRSFNNSKRSFVNKEVINYRLYTTKSQAPTSKSTFITLYPEPILLQLKNNLSGISEEPVASKRTDENHIYLVKSFTPVFSGGKRGDLDDQLNSSSGSLEDDWRTHRRQFTPTPENKNKEAIPEKISTHSPNSKLSRTIYKSYYKVPQLLRRSEDNIYDVIETNTKGSPSANYLERIKKLEEELNKVKEALKAKIYLLTNQTTTSYDIDNEATRQETYFKLVSGDILAADEAENEKTDKAYTASVYTKANGSQLTDEVKKLIKFQSDGSRQLLVDMPLNVTLGMKNSTLDNISKQNGVTNVTLGNFTAAQFEMVTRTSLGNLTGNNTDNITNSGTMKADVVLNTIEPLHYK